MLDHARGNRCLCLNAKEKLTRDHTSHNDNLILNVLHSLHPGFNEGGHLMGATSLLMINVSLSRMEGAGRSGCPDESVHQTDPQKR